MRCQSISTAIIAALAATALSAPTNAGETRLSSKMFFDFTNIDQNDSDSGKTDASGIGLDVKRFYFGVDHPFDDVWSGNLTTDFQYAQDDGLTNVYVKKAYLQGRFSKAAVLRIGSAGLPWIPFVEDYYGYRYVENTLVDRLKFGTSADWGLHLGGKLGQSGAFNYAASIVNGAGYKDPDRSESVDFEARVGFAPVEGIILALGGYSGKLGKQRATVDIFHTAKRADALVAYANKTFRVGAEYFRASNWNTVLTPAGDSADGWSVWASAALNDKFAVFARYDRADLSNHLDSAAEDTYYNAGVEYQLIKGFKLAAVYKHTQRDHTAGTPADNDLQTTNRRSNEIGIWGEVKF